jgi:hypothetical protein
VIEAFPLTWPPGRTRTAQSKRTRAAFDTTFARARDHLLREIKMLTRPHAPGTIISTNVPLRRDGIPYGTERAMSDPGVAVYFDYDGQGRVFACDRWLHVEDNMQAIFRTIEALRGIARWGTGDMMAAAFSGFTALPAPTLASTHEARPWREVLHFRNGEPVSLAVIQERFKRFAAIHHPDKPGGDVERMKALLFARDQAEAELKARYP